jgi:type III restriction enzyme
VILDSDWEAEFCRVAEAHPRVRAYVKNHNLGFEVPYRYGSEMRRYRPPRLHRAGRRRPRRGGPAEPHVEIKGYRGEDAKEKKTTMDTYWVPGVNNLGRPTAAGPSPSSPTSTRSRKPTSREQMNER